MRTAPAPNLLAHLSDDAVLDRFSEPSLTAGRVALGAGRVSRPALTARRAMAVVGEGRRSARTALRLSRDTLTVDCSCGAAWCGHAAALALLLRGDSPEDGGAGEESRAAPSLRDAERQRRVARGASELFEIRRQHGRGQGLLGEYEVASPSSRAYDVTLRALDAPHNGCTCPDFATNLLGTCKHVEAVLHHLRTDAPRRFRRAVAQERSAGYLHLVFEPDPSVGLRCSTEPRAAERRLGARFFGPEGRLAGALAEVWPELYRSAVEAGVEVPAEVARLGERHAAEARAERRSREVEAEVRARGAGAARAPPPALPLPGGRGRLPGLPGARAPRRRDGPRQDGPGHRRHGAARAPGRGAADARRLPRLAQAPVAPGDPRVHRARGARRAGGGRAAGGAPRGLRRGAARADHQLRARPGRRGRARGPGARSRHPRRGAAREELAHPDRRGGEGAPEPVRLRAHRHADREPARRSLQPHAGGGSAPASGRSGASTRSSPPSTPRAGPSATGTWTASGSESGRWCCGGERRRSSPTSRSGSSPGSRCR